MKYSVFYTKKAIADLESLEYKTAQKIITKIIFYSEQPNPVAFAKKLQPPVRGLYRFRIGTYRATFSIENGRELTLLNILQIKHRKDAYED